MSECVEAIKKNSRNFAKRQYTWFRNQLEVQWYDVKEPNWKEQCMRQLQEWRKTVMEHAETRTELLIALTGIRRLRKAVFAYWESAVSVLIVRRHWHAAVSAD